MPPMLRQEDVRRLCEFLYRRTGMLFAEDKRYYIDRRLHERIAATGAPSFQAYFALLRSDQDREIEHLVNAFTVNETYFFREDHQLRCMTSDLMGAILRNKRASEPVRIWSVPCSTGEEPYSIGIWLMEHFPGSTTTTSRSSAPTSTRAPSPRRPMEHTERARS